MYATTDFIKDNQGINFLNSGTLSVDTFFVIGGILTGYIFTKKFQNLPSDTSLLQKIKLCALSWLHRFLRMVPCITIYILFGIWFYTSQDPAKSTYPKVQNYNAFETCKDAKTFFETIFMVTWLNYRPSCVGQLWYVACEIWFFVITIPLIFLITSEKKMYQMASYGIVIGLIITSLSLRAWLSSYLGLYFSTVSFKPCPDDWVNDCTLPNEHWWQDIYFKPWTRLSTYFIGVLTGVFLQKTSRVLKLSLYQQILAWCSILTITTFLVYGMPLILVNDNYFPQWFSVTYDTIMRSLWGIAISAFVILLETNNGFTVYSFLSSDWWLFFSKTNFGAYLTHLTILSNLIVLAFPESYHYTWPLMVIISTALFVCMYVCGTIFYVFVEVPVAKAISFLLPINKW